MQKNYLVAAFEQTAAERFPAQGPELLWHRTKRWAAGTTAATSGSWYKNKE